MNGPFNKLDLTINGLVQAFDEPRGGRRMVLDIPAFHLKAGQRIAIGGPSGAGKSSLVHLLAGIDRPQSGTICWGACNITNLSESARDQWRRHHIGLVFQDFHLIDGLSPIDNVTINVRFSRFGMPADDLARARSLMTRLSLDPDLPRIDHLSRGERQRLAIARALIMQPEILLADEPTASLDAKAASDIGTLLVDLSRETGASLITITHDAALARQMDQCFQLIDCTLVPNPGPGFIAGEQS